MDDFVPVQRVQTLQKAVGELPNQLQREALELVLLDQLVEVDGEKLEGDAGVAPEAEVVIHVDDVERVVLVLLGEMLQDANLLLSLAVKPLFVSDHLEGDVLVRLVVVDFQDLTEGAFANYFEDFVAIGDVVVGDVGVGALFIIISTVARSANNAGSFLGVSTDEVDLRIVEYFVVFVRS